jgi:flavodoxin/NAD-dependent dihydropyrimidine dehydrogenase PreA subunit
MLSGKIQLRKRKMQNALIYVFSGTGNTLLTADMLGSHLESQGVKTTIYSINTGGSPPPQDDFDCIGFGYPVYAYNMPEIFYRFVRDLPDARDKKAFVFKTSGEPFRLNKVSSYKLLKMLEKKGYDVILEQHLLMPYNILFRYPDGLSKQMYFYSDALCKMLSKRLLGGERDTFKFNSFYVFASWLLRFQWPGARLNGRLYSVNKKRCSKCMQCVKDCPEGNISFKDGRLRFGWRCNMCMRCAMFCPTDAINIGLIPFFKINKPYDFRRLLADQSISANHVNPETKGYFRLFRKFFRRADCMLADHGIDLPVI